ncbi:MAG TPA: sigma-54 dependent transcriptional regulator [Gallionellaceae bacterium]
MYASSPATELPAVSAEEADVPDSFGSWPQSSVLVVDDEPGMRSFLTRALSARCGQVAAAASVEEATRLIDEKPFDLLILDIALPGKSGVEWLHELRALGYHQDVILITAFADLDTAIGALRGGASDFILKPFRIDQLLGAINRCFDRAQLKRENFLLKRAIASHCESEPDHFSMVGESQALQEIKSLVQRLAPLPSTVLITGESGTGKEVVARALHQFSQRAARPFVAINCGAIAPELIESELFGHSKGAFTGAAGAREGLFFYAQGGTLFLDEVGEMPLNLQAKLLRVLDEKKIRPVGSDMEIPVDVRIIAATNRALADHVKNGSFRQDLYFRLDVINIHLPPLRERPEDIAPLALHFMHLLAARMAMTPVTLDAGTLDKMRRYGWPGNARELRNVIERTLILGRVPDACLGNETTAAAAAEPEQGESLEAVEKRHILSVLSAMSGNKTEAARRLNISRKTLDRKCAEWGVQ